MMTVAGQDLSIEECVARLHKYAIENHRAVEEYDDLVGGPLRSISPEQVRATRRMSSRISQAEVDWFVDRAAETGTPWIEGADSDLVDADPAVHGGLYDHALDLFDWFAGTGKMKIGTAKVSKVLYLKYPALFPILDSRLSRLYRAEAERSADRYRDQGRDYRRMYWSAIRDDVIANRATGALDDARQRLRTAADSGDAHSDRILRLTRLSDLRLLDVLAWTEGH
ncbi:DUF6308 family protein [Nakamurella alba]|nr:DUF6308 family protein [Nakamurella alba]